MAIDIATDVSFIAALSVASERLVEIVKGSIPWLSQTNSNATMDGWRKAALQVLALGAGVLTAYLASTTNQSVVPHGLSHGWGICITGLLVSGGSGFWNSILTYVQASRNVQVTKAAAKP